MSTYIEEVKGWYHNGITDTMTPRVERTMLNINRFHGGDKGSMIQLTPLNDSGYVMFTKDEVKELIDILQDVYNYDKYPSE